MDEFLDAFYLIVFDVDMVPAFATPDVYPVVHGVFVDGLEFPGHHGLVHKNLVPGHPVPLVVPREQERKKETDYIECVNRF
jgi:hypothetical protein